MPLLRTSIHTSDTSPNGKMLRLAARLMGEEIGPRGWVGRVIRHALEFYIECMADPDKVLAERIKAEEGRATE